MPIYKLKDKPGYRVQVNYTDSFGKKQVIVKQNKDTLTLKGAKQIEAEILTEINNFSLKNKDMALDELHQFYVSAIQNEVKISSMSTKLKRYKNQIAPYFGNKKINKITIGDFQKWKQEIINKGYSLEYSNGVYAEFNAILNFGVKYEVLKSNHLIKLGCFKNPDAPIKQHNVWKNEEFNQFINVVKHKCEEYEKTNQEDDLIQWGYYVMYNILFYCGCRKGEVYPIQWQDINFNTRVMKIRKNLLYKIKKGTYIITTPKTKGSVRDIILPHKLIDILQEHKARYSLVEGFNDSFYVCGGLIPNTDTKLAEFKNKCAKECGLHQIKIHEFRHSHASMLINNKVPPLAIMQRLGHSSLRELFETYAQLFKENEYAVADVIDTL